MIECAGTVYPIDQLRSELVFDLRRYVPTIRGKRCPFLDESGGRTTHLARTTGADAVLIAVWLRHYGADTMNICEGVADAGVPIVAIWDTTLSPLAKSVRILFAVPEDDHIFFPSLAVPDCLAKTLAVAVVARLQKMPKRRAFRQLQPARQPFDY